MIFANLTDPFHSSSEIQNMKQKINIENWNRKDHFTFFNQFEEPFYGATVTIDCTLAYQKAKKEGISFFLYYLYQSLKASQQVDAFLLRVIDNEVFRYDHIDGQSTVGRPDGTFGFAHFDYYPELNDFLSNANSVVQQVQNQPGLKLFRNENVIRYSALPWIDFTSLSHARMFAVKDSCPKISFGKVSTHHEKKTMPVSIHVHHALVDGIDLGKYVDCFQEFMNQP